MGKADLFAGRLKELRTAAGLSLKELAERAKITPDAIVKLESGNRKPGWETVIALSDALGVECTAFLQELAPAPTAGPGRPRKSAAARDRTDPRPDVRRGEAPPAGAACPLAGLSGYGGQHVSGPSTGGAPAPVPHRSPGPHASPIFPCPEFSPPEYNYKWNQCFLFVLWGAHSTLCRSSRAGG